MSTADIIITIILSVIVIVIVAVLIRNKKKGKGSCSSGIDMTAGNVQTPVFLRLQRMSESVLHTKSDPVRPFRRRPYRYRIITRNF